MGVQMALQLAAQLAYLRILLTVIRYMSGQFAGQSLGGGIRRQLFGQQQRLLFQSELGLKYRQTLHFSLCVQVLRPLVLALLPAPGSEKGKEQRQRQTAQQHDQAAGVPRTGGSMAHVSSGLRDC